jgi:hypothetical protein
MHQLTAPEKLSSRARCFGCLNLIVGLLTIGLAFGYFVLTLFYLRANSTSLVGWLKMLQGSALSWFVGILLAGAGGIMVFGTHSVSFGIPTSSQ